MALVLLAGACKDDPSKSYETFQLCFEDQTEKEGLLVVDAIVACCIDHPIAGESPACGADEPACINFLTDNLDQTDAGIPERMQACQLYGDQIEQPGA
jgi:hypothetical protein